MYVDNELNRPTVETQAFALATRLHVLMRREKIRVTDVEYMTQDRSYCRHVLDLARSTESPDLREVCSRLDALYFGADGIFARKPPPLEMPVAVARAEPAPKAAPKVAPTPAPQLSDRYIGRLR